MSLFLSREYGFHLTLCSNRKWIENLYRTVQPLFCPLNLSQGFITVSVVFHFDSLLLAKWRSNL